MEITEEDDHLIRATQLLIKKFSRLQDEAFKDLKLHMANYPDKSMEDWLWDFVYNENEETSFRVFLAKHGQ